MKIRKMGALRAASSAPGPLPACSVLSQPAPAFDADIGGQSHEEFWKHRSNESQADLSAHTCERLPHAYVAAPKLVLRPLSMSASPMEQPFLVHSTYEVEEKHILHTAEDSQTYGPVALARHYNESYVDVDTEWAPSHRASNFPFKLPFTISSNHHVSAPALVPTDITQAARVRPYRAHGDVAPYDTAEPLPPQPLPSKDTHGGLAAASLLQQHIARIAGGAKSAQPPTLALRPSYGQRVLLQRLPQPTDIEVSYLQGITYIEPYGYDSREESCNQASKPVSQPLQQPHSDRPPPLYNGFQDAVQNHNLYSVRRGGHQPHPADMTHPQNSSPCGVRRDGALRAPAAPWRLLEASDVLPMQYEWARLDVAPKVRLDEDASVHRCSGGGGNRGSGGDGGSRGTRKSIRHTVTDADVPGASGGSLCNLEALADVACRAAELLGQDEEQEATEEEEDEAQAGQRQILESGSAALYSSGQWRRGRSMIAAAEEPRVYGRGARRRPSTAIATTAAGMLRQHQQQQLPVESQSAPLGIPGSRVSCPDPSSVVIGGALSLPLTVLHQDRKCPKVLAPRSGRLGDTKHLVLPAEIVQVLPRALSYGVQPIRVRALVPATTAAIAAAANSQVEVQEGSQLDSPQLECDILCQIGNGPGGFPALHLPVSEVVYGRPVRRFTLRKDMVLELELGDAVVKPSRFSGGGGSRKRIAESSSEATDNDQDDNIRDGGAVEDTADIIVAAAPTAASAPRVAGSSSEAGTSPLLGAVTFASSELGCVREQVVAVERGLELVGKGLVVTGLSDRAVPGGGSGSNMSDDTRVDRGAAGVTAVVATATTAPPPTEVAVIAAANVLGGGGRRRGTAAVTLPIVVRRPTTGKPTVMRSCTGVIGSKKHLPLPASIIKALTPGQRGGTTPVEVVVVYSDSHSSASLDCGGAVPPEQPLSCFVGPTGSHGCTALQVPVDRTMHSRRLLSITLRDDMVVELSLGDSVEVSAAATAAARESGSDAADEEVTQEVTAVEAAEGAESSKEVERGSDGGSGSGSGSGCGVAATLMRYDSKGPTPSKRRRSSSIPPSDSLEIGAAMTTGGGGSRSITAAAVAAAPSRRTPPPQVPYAALPPTALLIDAAEYGIRRMGTADDDGDYSAVKEVDDHHHNDDDALNSIMALVVKAGLGPGAMEMLWKRLQPQVQELQRQPSPRLPQQQLQRQRRAQLYSQQPISTSNTTITAAASAAHGAVSAPHLTPRRTPPSAYGMSSYVPTSAAPDVLQPNRFTVKSEAQAVRRTAFAVPYSKPHMDSYGGPSRQSYDHSGRSMHRNDTDRVSQRDDVNGITTPVDDAVLQRQPRGVAPPPRMDVHYAAATLARAWTLLRHAPHAQMAADRALAAAGVGGVGQGGGGGDIPDRDSAALKGFCSCLAGIESLLMRAQDVALEDLEVHLGGVSSGASSAAASRSSQAHLLAAAPTMLNATENLLEWYHLLASAGDERTAESYAVELADTAAFVKAQLAHKLMRLVVAAPTRS